MSRLSTVASASVGLGLGLVSALLLWMDCSEQTNHTVFFHLARNGNPIIFGVERDELLRHKGRGAGRIREALTQQDSFPVTQYSISRAENGRFRIGPEKKIELTPADAKLIRFGANFVIP